MSRKPVRERDGLGSWDTWGRQEGQGGLEGTGVSLDCFPFTLSCLYFFYTSLPIKCGSVVLCVSKRVVHPKEVYPPFLFVTAPGRSLCFDRLKWTGLGRTEDKG